MIILWDSSALISLLDSKRAFHETAKECYRRFLEKDELQLISTIAISELAVKNDPQPLLKLNFQMLDFNICHATAAADLKKETLDNDMLRDQDNTRVVIINDMQLIGQAHVEQVNYILTEDEKTLYKTVEFLRDKAVVTVKAILLRNSPLAAMGYDCVQATLGI